MVAGSPPALATVDVTPDAETGEFISPLAAFLTNAALEAGTIRPTQDKTMQLAGDFERSRLQGRISVKVTPRAG